MDIQNHYYGHSAILATHAGLPNPRHINGLLQHGWTIESPTTVHFHDFPRLPRGARRLVWSHRSRAWSAATDAFPTTAIGAPWLYLADFFGDRAPAEPLGPAVFPMHGTHIAAAEFDADAFARHVADRYGPATICLHAEDLGDASQVRALTRYGHRTTSAGGRRDPRFLMRIMSLVRASTVVISNELSTALLYAASAGVPVSIEGPPGLVAEYGHDGLDRKRILWPEFYGVATDAERQRIALDELGSASLRSPGELREILGWDHRTARPAVEYWIGSPIRKASAVLGLSRRVPGSGVAASGASPLLWLRQPLSHLPGRLPRGIDLRGEPDLLQHWRNAA